jgi:hypothetical protein
MYNKPISELVKDPEWQKVRESLLEKWKTKPNWCIIQLKKYLGNIKTSDEKKLIIVLNYLTGSAFRTGIISSIDNPEISKLRGEISAELKRRKYEKS